MSVARIMTDRLLRVFLTPLLFVVVVLGLTGCAGGNNPHDDWVLMSTSSEKEMGESAAKQLENQVGLYGSDTFTRYVDNVGSRVAVYSERPDLDYKFEILDIFMINALALPGGYIYVTRGLLKQIDSEAELAGVLAHEVGHVAAYHAIKRQQWSIISLLSAAAVATQTGGRGLGESLMAQQMIIRGYTRSSEDQADRLGMRYSAQAGYDPLGLINFLEELKRVHGEIPQQEILMMRTHPFLTDRIQTSRANLDYYRSLSPDTPIVNRLRYQRYKRRYLFQPAEQAFMKVFKRFVEAYENQNIDRIKSMLAKDFQVGSRDASDTRTRADFLEDLEGRFRRSVNIEYDYRLMDLNVGDTEATIQYEFKDTRHRAGSSVPQINQGLQAIDWRKRDQSWLMKTLK